MRLSSFQPRRAEDGDATARGSHFFDQGLIHRNGSDGVQQHTHLDSAATGGGQLGGELPCDLTLPVDVGQQIDRLPRIADGSQHGRKDLVAVLQQLDTISFEKWRVEVGRQDRGQIELLRVLEAYAIGQDVGGFCRR